MNLWPDVVDSLTRCEKLWTIYDEFPLPKRQFDCPVCSDPRDNARIKHFLFHEKTVSPSKYRCDVVFKCINCSAVWVHGVVIPEEMFLKRQARKYTWREARDIIEKNKRNLVIIYKADNPDSIYQWFSMKVTINNKQDTEMLMGFMGDLIFIDLMYFDPEDSELLHLVKAIKKATDTTTLENIQGFVKMAGKPLYEREK